MLIEIKFSIWKKNHVCISESGLFCVTELSPVASIFLQMPWFNYVYVTKEINMVFKKKEKQMNRHD